MVWCWLVGAHTVVVGGGLRGTPQTSGAGSCVNIPSPPKLLLQLLESDYSVGRIFLLNLVLCPILNIHNAVSLSLLPWMLR